MYQSKFQTTKIQNLLERSEKIPQTPDASLLACCPIASPSSSSLSLSPSPRRLHLLCTSLTPYEQLVVAEGSGAMAWSSRWWCWLPVALVTLVPVVRGSTCNPPHKQLLMDVWQVLVRRALGKVVGGHQCEAAGKRGVGCVPALYGPPSTVPSHRRPLPSLSVPRSTPLVSSFIHHLGHGVPVLGVIPQVFSLKNQLV
jgi:hypothetical protein